MSKYRITSPTGEHQRDIDSHFDNITFLTFHFVDFTILKMTVWTYELFTFLCFTILKKNLHLNFLFLCLYFAILNKNKNFIELNC